MAYRRSGFNVFNKHNIQFNVNQVKQLQRLTRQANRASKQIRSNIDAFSGLTRAKEIRTARDVNTLTFEIKVKSQSLNQFRTKKEFKEHVQKLQSLVKGDLFNERVENLKEAYYTSIDKQFSTRSAKILKEQIRNADDKDFYYAVQNKEFESIGFVYHDRQSDKEAYMIEEAEKLFGNA